jgi:hypothetical protein
MQVSDSSPPGPPGGPAKDEVRAPHGERENAGRGRSGQRFRSVLDRKGREPGSGANADDAASAAAMAGWFRAESGGAAQAPARAAPVAATSRAGAVDRVLIGSGPDGAQARIRIGAGALAGTEIQLSSGAAGHAVEARLLTHAASSRQTLAVVMDEIRVRLRDRGIVLSTKAAPVRPGAQVADIDGRDHDGAVWAARERAESGR